jgi:nucleolar protein 15
MPPKKVTTTTKEAPKSAPVTKSTTTTKSAPVTKAKAAPVASKATTVAPKTKAKAAKVIEPVEESEEEAEEEEELAAVFDEESEVEEPVKPTKGKTKAKDTTTTTPTTATTATTTTTTTTTTTKNTKTITEPVDVDAVEKEDKNEIGELQKTFFASLTSAEQIKQFEKIRQQLGSQGFDKALSKIVATGGIQGSVVHTKTADSTQARAKKSAEYEQYVRVRAAPHRSGGVVYIGHLPEGFTENPMKKFFKQFGEVKRVHLSRAKKTGKYRGYGFVEFSDKQVAAIVAESMDKYMMFGRTLQCQYIPYDQLHPETFRNNFRQFRQINFTQIHNDQVNQLKNDAQIEKLRGNQVSKLLKRQEQLKKMGLSLDDVSISMGDDVITLDDVFSDESNIIAPNKKQRLSKSYEAQAKDKIVQLPKATASVVVSKGKKAAAPVATVVEPVVEETKKRARPAATKVVEESKPVVKAAAKPPVVEKVPVKKAVAKKTK